jgi:hypothetical protein
MLMDGVSPSDELGYTFMMTGMAKRMGDQSKPLVALTHPPASALGDVASRRQAGGWNVQPRWVGVNLLRRRSPISWCGAWVTSFLLGTLLPHLACWADLKLTHPEHGPWVVGLAPAIGFFRKLR